MREHVRAMHGVITSVRPIAARAALGVELKFSVNFSLVRIHSMMSTPSNFCFIAQDARIESH